jgi:hypothetical protein
MDSVTLSSYLHVGLDLNVTFVKSKWKVKGSFEMVLNGYFYSNSILNLYYFVDFYIL